MKKRILLRGSASAWVDGRGQEVEILAEEELVELRNDGVAVLRQRAGKEERWFPNWRVVSVEDVPDGWYETSVGPRGPRKDPVLPIAPFKPVTPKDLVSFDLSPAVKGSNEHGFRETGLTP